MTGIFFSYLLFALAIVLAVPVAVILVEVLAAVAHGKSRDARQPTNVTRQRVAVLVPAHNESKGILQTIRDIQSQLRPGDRLIAIADNCTDDTAAVAAGAGAQVV